MIWIVNEQRDRRNEQERFLEAEAESLGVELRKAEGSEYDRNRTFLIISGQEKPFFEFENSDSMERFSFDFACHGRIDLRDADWMNHLGGAIEKEFYRHLQYSYVRNQGGVSQYSGSG